MTEWQEEGRQPMIAVEQARETLERRSTPVPESGCTLWLGAINSDGYGNMWIDSKQWRTNRAAWEAYRGPIPLGLLVCHKCDVRSCINLDHLFLGTVTDNANDMHRKGRGGNVSGERNGHHKLTDQQIADVRESSGSQQSIARHYGVSQSLVSRIKSHQRWKHLT